MLLNKLTSHGHIISNQSDPDAPLTENQDRNTNMPRFGLNCARSKKKFDVSFLKVHKAGSTTVMNIFLRFAIGHELNIVLPRSSKGNGFNYLGYGKTVTKENIVPLPVNETYNILCNHVVYNRAAFQSILPDDTIYIGIVREPASHFKSAAVYYGFVNKLRAVIKDIPQENVISEFLKDPSKWKVSTYFVHNRMSFDFGMPKNQFKNDSFISSYINELSQDYSLVLILEYFQVSLVLMKRELCWSTKDILYVPLNAMKSNLTFDLDNDVIERLNQWNRADVKLYDHFLNTFKEKVKSQREDFYEEVELFKTVQRDVETFCKYTVSRREAEQTLTVQKSKWDDSFIVTNDDCVLMMEREEPMVKRLIENAWARYNASLTPN